MGKGKQVSVFAQGGRLKYFFPDSTLKVVGYDKKLIWEGSLKPTTLSASYNVKIEYTLGHHPNVYVTSPSPLPLAKGEGKLPHVYDQRQQRLCLYHKGMQEWNGTQMIADTIIPWTSEWLLHYEYWIATTVWHGGGIH